MYFVLNKRDRKCVGDRRRLVRSFSSLTGEKRERSSTNDLFHLVVISRGNGTNPDLAEGIAQTIGKNFLF